MNFDFEISRFDYIFFVLGVIFVIDSADKERVQEAKEELHRILASQELRGAPIVLVANKQDLPGKSSKPLP